MHATSLPKLFAATALALAALGTTPLAHAGTGMPQKDPERIGGQKHPERIGGQKHPERIGGRKHQERIGSQ